MVLALSQHLIRVSYYWGVVPEMVSDCDLGVSQSESPARGLAGGGRVSLPAPGNSGQKGGGAIFSGFWFYLWL